MLARRLSTRPLAAAAFSLAVLSFAGCARGARGGAAGGPSPARGGELPLKYSGPATGAAISAGDLMTRLYVFADDSMMGRDAGSEFNARGTAYIEREVRRMGLEPGGDDGYFQHPLVFVATDPTLSTLSVRGVSYTLWRDFAPRNQGAGARPFDGAPVVYGGTFGDTAHMIAPAAGAGRVVLTTLAPDSTGRPDWNSVNRGWLVARYPDAAAVVVVFMDYAPPGYVDQVFASRQLGVRGTGATDVGPSYFYVSAAIARIVMGGDPATMTPGSRGATTMRGAMRFAESPAPGRNVIAILRGSDPVLRNEYVVIGAHNDHVGFNHRPADHDSIRAFNAIARRQGVETPPRRLTPEEAQRFAAVRDSLHALHGGARPDSIYNGADDDGSGSVSLLEIAQAYAGARVRPKRSLLFIWQVGEEYGMFGSRYFTDHPTVPRDAIVADLNIDMIGRGRAGDITGVTSAGALIEGGPGYLQLIGSRRLSTELGNLVETVNTEGRFGLRFDYALDANGHPQNIYCRSDHAMYARWGIPVVFFTTGGHADYHQVTDEPQYIDYDHMATIARMVYTLAGRVANLDHRPVVDGPRPDPNGACQQ